MAQDVKLNFSQTKDVFLLCHNKCGEWPYLFATSVANTKILLDIAGLGSAKHSIMFQRFRNLKKVKKHCPRVSRFI